MILFFKRKKTNKKEQNPFCFDAKILFLSNKDTMIIAHIPNNFKSCHNFINQGFYNRILIDLDISKITCHQCDQASFHYHGTYKRHIVNTNLSVTNISVQRIQCYHCKITHAILVVPMVPYSNRLHLDLLHLHTISSTLQRIINTTIYETSGFIVLCFAAPFMIFQPLHPIPT